MHSAVTSGAIKSNAKMYTHIALYGKKPGLITLPST